MKLNYEVEYPILQTGNRLPKLMNLVKEFEDSGQPVAKIELGAEDQYSSAVSLRNSLEKAIERCKKKGIYQAVRRKDMVFLVKLKV